MGSNNQPRLNPLAKRLSELEGFIRALEDRYGLSPQSRLRLGVEFASARRSLADIAREFDGDHEPDPRLQPAS